MIVLLGNCVARPKPVSVSTPTKITSIADETRPGKAEPLQRERLQAWGELRDLLDSLPAEPGGDLVDFLDAAFDLASGEPWADVTRLAGLPEWCHRRGLPSAGAAYGKAIALHLVG